MKNKPENFKLEETSIWSFPDRGNWSTHNGNYRGNWSPYVVRNLILRYSKEQDVILDQFVGSGTTIIEAILLKRYSIGIDINPDALKITSNNLSIFKSKKKFFKLINGDARYLSSIPDNSIDFILTHPPYSDIIKYSYNIPGDISLLTPNDFIKQIYKIAKNSYRVLKNNKFCAIMIGDVRKKGVLYPLGFELMNVFLKNGFILKEIIIKKQHNCRSTNKWINVSKEKNFLLLQHEYIFIFKKL